MFFTKLFAPRDSAPPCGMLNKTHFTALFITLAIIAVCFFLCRKVNHEQLKHGIKIFSVVLTVLEFIQIGYNFAYGYTWPDAWLPLNFCALFLYACYLAGFGKGFVEKIGEAFLMCGCPTAGLAFLIFPTTSLAVMPIYHYLSLYSLFFHGAMLLVGLLYVFRSERKFTRKLFGAYAAFCSVAALLAIMVNTLFGANMMFLSAPFNAPLRFIFIIYESSRSLYTLMIMAAYLSCFFVSWGIYALVRFIRRELAERRNKRLSLK